MKIILKKEMYDGADGTSITEDRCEKYLSLLSMTDQMGDRIVNYKYIQNHAKQLKLFPDTGNIPSAIRTIVPILSKFGFIIDYNNRKSFPSCSFFTRPGKMFVYVLDAIKKQKEMDFPNQTLSQLLDRTKLLILQLGLLNMANSFPDNKIWIIYYLMQEIGHVNSNMFFYVLYSLQNGKDVKEAINEIKQNKQIINNEYLKEDNTVLEKNPFFFRAGILRDLGLAIQKMDNNYYLTSESDIFLSQLRESILPENKNKQYISLLL